jgi:hypothetical protein
MRLPDCVDGVCPRDHHDECAYTCYLAMTMTDIDWEAYQ